MTSAEFAAKYHVLKTFTEQGAHTVIAQEIALGRMVMVHHLSVGSAIERQRLLAGVTTLNEASATKVLDLFDVDGTAVVVTQFLATFTDLPTWLRVNATATDAATLVIPGIRRPSASAVVPPAPVPAPAFAPPAPVTTPTFAPPPPAQTFAPPAPVPAPTGAPAAPTSADPPAKPAGGSFTEMFGAVRSQPGPIQPKPATVQPPSSPPPASPGGDFTRQFQAIKPAGPPTDAASSPPPSVSSGRPSGFTQIFGKVATPDAGGADPASGRSPFAPAAPAFGQSPASSPPPLQMAPASPRFDLPPVPPPVPAAPPPPSPAPQRPDGDFTQLFARLETPGSVPVIQPAPPPPPPPRPPATTPPPTPVFGAPAVGGLNAPSWQATPPLSMQPVAPPTPMPNAIVPTSQPSAAAGASEFTRVLGRVQVPPPASAPIMAPSSSQMPAPQMPAPQLQVPPMALPPVPQLPQVPPSAVMPPVPPVPAFGAPALPAATPVKSRLPLIIVLNVLALVTIGVILYFVLSR